MCVICGSKNCACPAQKLAQRLEATIVWETCVGGEDYYIVENSRGERISPTMNSLALYHWLREACGF